MQHKCFTLFMLTVVTCLLTIAVKAQCLPLAATPSANQNYILIKTFKVAGVNAGNINNSRNICQENQTIQYLDGLGRPIQNVHVQANPFGNDLVQPIAYDALGRQRFSYLTYTAVGSNGSYRSDALQAGAGLANFYNPSPGGTSGSQMSNGVVSIPTPYVETAFEASPLDRVVEQGAAGNTWQLSAGHTQKISYSINNSSTSYATTGFAVRLYTATPVATVGLTYQRILGGTGYYAADQLVLTINKDENWTATDQKAGTTETYKDKENRIVLKRTFNKVSATIEVLSTYYVYDELGNLSFVLPSGADPDAASVPLQTTLDNICFQYRYDERKRLIEKKLPGKGWEYLVYNKLDQVVLSQDANGRAAGEWLFTKYDALQRSVITGMVSSAASRTDWQASINAQGTLWETRDNGNGNSTNVGYTNLSLPSVSLTNCYTLNYYDDYDFYNNSFGQPVNPQVTGARVKGLPTGSRVNVLGSGTHLLSVSYYDDEGKLLQQRSQNHLGGTDVVDNTYNFADELTAGTRTHVVSGSITTIAATFGYDHMGRKLSATSNINNQGAVVLNKFSYNEVGQLLQKQVHSTDAGTNFLQSGKYAYNERGWLKNSASAQFSMKLGYDTLSSPQYNGNIAIQSWGNGTSQFLYSYDKLNRLTSGINSGISPMSETISYDVMGNITSLNRDGVLGSYAYSGNRLNSISGGLATATYSYDANGNATTDGRNGATLTYNYLNQPVTATNSGLNLTYSYDATGKKLKKVSSTTSTTTDYIDGIQYANGAIDFIQTEEGRAKNTSGTYVYEYNLTDHIGNVRYSFDKNAGVLRQLQADDYYPFGLRKVASAGNNKYLYNAKELQEELGQYDYGARQYDPIIGRFNTIDRFAEKYINLNPYQYGANNPVLNIDINGDSLRISHKGQDYLYQSGKLYQNGTEYTGKVKGFLKETVNALGKINAGKEGSTMISELEGSTNNFTIVKGNSQFNASSSSKAYANQLQTDPSQAGTLQALTAAGINLQGGSGGKISWDPSGSMLPTTNGGQTNSTTDLAHEMFHGLDANRGMLNDRLQNGVRGSEWQAVYRENVLRGQIGQPLRTHYIKSVDPSGAYVGGSGIRMITPANQAILPTGYKP